jgi:phosphoesterase family protein/fibronectin type III domain protein
MERAVWRQVKRVVGALLLAVSLGANACPAEAEPTIPRPARVVIVIEENHSYARIIGNPQAPYINSLAQQGASFTRSFAVTHPSQPNYLALFSGSTQGVTDDACPYSFSTPNLGRQLIDAGLSFTGYSEDLPTVGFAGCTFAQYARKHNPWVNWQVDVSPSPNAVPIATNQPFTSFPSDFTDLPTVSIVVPNLDDDMHDGTIAQADAWLRQHLDPYVQWARTNNGLLILTWDESNSPAANRIPTIFVGPMVSPALYDEPIDHYRVLRTLEDMYDLAPIGEATATVAITDVWIDPALGAPASLSAQPLSSSSIELGWVDTSAGETGFKVLRSSDGLSFTEVATVGPGVTSYTNTGLRPSTTYYYKVKAFAAGGNSADSDVASARTLPRR